MKSQKPPKSTKKEEVIPALTMDKLSSARNKMISQAEEIKPGPTPYLIVTDDDIVELVRAVNIMIKLAYEPVGGASFSTKLGFWYQTLLLPPDRREVKKV